MYNIKLSEIMTSDLITLSPEDNMEAVEKTFKENDFHHLPIVNRDEKLVGIISKSDYLMLCDSMSFFQKSNQELRNKRLFQSMLVQDVMKKNVAKLKPDSTVKIAVGFFKENKFHAIPVVDKDDKLLGIVTTFDLINLAFREPIVQA